MSMRTAAPTSTPYCAARRASWAAYALATSVLVGMQPVLTQVPPKSFALNQADPLTGGSESLGQWRAGLAGTDDEGVELFLRIHGRPSDPNCFHANLCRTIDAIDMISGLELSLIGAALLVGVALATSLLSCWPGRRREDQLAQLVSPLQAALEATRTQAQRLDAEHRETEANLRGHIELLARGQAGLAQETRNLVTALRRPEVRGRWGELTLRRVVRTRRTGRAVATSPSRCRSAATAAFHVRI